MCGLVPSFYTGLGRVWLTWVYEELEVSLLSQPDLSAFSVEVKFCCILWLIVVNTTIRCDYANLFIVFSPELNIY